MAKIEKRKINRATAADFKRQCPFFDTVLYRNSTSRVEASAFCGKTVRFWQFGQGQVLSRLTAIFRSRSSMEWTTTGRFYTMICVLQVSHQAFKVERFWREKSKKAKMLDFESSMEVLKELGSLYKMYQL